MKEQPTFTTEERRRQLYNVLGIQHGAALEQRMDGITDGEDVSLVFDVHRKGTRKQKEK